MNNNFDRLARDVSRDIESYIESSGILYRIFNRAKSLDSIKRKMKVKKYRETSRLMQDAIGIRITLYFTDDIDIVYNILRKHPDYLDETRDGTDDSSFKPKRLNIIFKLKNNYGEELLDQLGTEFNNIDKTYEIQIRTMFSEGWHEVEHDLRYKNQKDWENHQDISRILNGIYATLETQDWSILTVFEKLAYRHYRDGNWNAMIRNKIRIRFLNNHLDDKILNILNNDRQLAKEFFKIDRKEFIKKIIDIKLKIPLTMDNVIYLINIFFVKNRQINEMIPISLRKDKKLFPKGLNKKFTKQVSDN